MSSHLVVLRLLEPSHQWVHLGDERKNKLPTTSHSKTDEGTCLVFVDKHVVVGHDRGSKTDHRERTFG